MDVWKEPSILKVQANPEFYYTKFLSQVEFLQKIGKILKQN